MTTSLAGPSVVSAENARQYHQEGYMILPGVIPPAMLAMLREECQYFVGYEDGFHARQGQQGPKANRYFISNRYRQSPRLWQFLYSELLADICRATLGDEAFLFYEQWVVKGARTGGAFAWHQDSGYVSRGQPQADARPYLTLWCTLDDVTPENGTVYILPHSRAGTKGRILEHVRPQGEGDLVGYTGSDPGIPVVCPAGSIAAFSSFTLHRSGANTTDNLRRVYLAQYSCEPVYNAKGELFAQAVPFVQGGRIVYDRQADQARPA